MGISNKCIVFFTPFIIVISAPFGSGITELVIIITSILIMPPIINPAITAMMFFN